MILFPRLVRPWHRHWEERGEFAPGCYFVERLTFWRWALWKLRLRRPKLCIAVTGIDPTAGPVFWATPLWNYERAAAAHEPWTNPVVTYEPRDP